MIALQRSTRTPRAGEKWFFVEAEGGAVVGARVQSDPLPGQTTVRLVRRRGRGEQFLRIDRSKLFPTKYACEQAHGIKKKPSILTKLVARERAERNS
jgi:hypothetical protein